MVNQTISTMALIIATATIFIMGAIILYYISMNPADVNELFVMP